MPRSMLEVEDLEARPNGADNGNSIPSDGGAMTGNKDLMPNLAPTKSMDFPDGMTLICVNSRRFKGVDDGGGRISLSVLFFWLTSGSTLITGFINSVGVFQTYYEQGPLRDYSAFQIGWISSFLIFSMNFGVIISRPR
jgi:hypothetical protein